MKSYYLAKDLLKMKDAVKKAATAFGKWQADDIPAILFLATKAQGEWIYIDNTDGTISVTWAYTYFATNIITYPLVWVFVSAFQSGLQQ